MEIFCVGGGDICTGAEYEMLIVWVSGVAATVMRAAVPA